MPRTIDSPSGIKSRQSGVIGIAGSTTTATATVTAVNTAKCRLTNLGSYTSVDSTMMLAGVDLTNSTTITANRTAATGTTYVSWELIEEY